MASSTKWLLLAGAAGLGVYAYTQRKRATEVARVTPGAPTEPPGLLDSLLGAAKEAAKRYAELEAKMRLRGSAHHAAWKKAMSTGAQYYNVGGRCFTTATTLETAMRRCQAQDLE